MADLPTNSSAVISDCGRYRYWLERSWGDGFRQVFVMLNPSTADASEDDPTIRRCVAFAKREGAGGLIVVNLFAWRATDPREIAKATDPIGPENAEHVGMALLSCAVSAKPAICAWGANAFAQAQGERLKARSKDFGIGLMCLGMTKSGAPKHPLYLKSDAPLIPFETEEFCNG